MVGVTAQIAIVSLLDGKETKNLGDAAPGDLAMDNRRNRDASSQPVCYFARIDRAEVQKFTQSE
jgi:hypothetical protein